MRKIMVNKYKNIVILVMIAMAMITTVNAQYGSFGLTDAQNVSMGNTYTANSFGTTAIGKNPAMMLYPLDSSSVIYLQIPNFAVQTGGNSLSGDDINKYFGSKDSKYLSKADKDDILSKFKNDLNYYADLGSKDIAISWKHSDAIGAIGLAISDYVGGQMTMPADFIDLALSGNTLNKQFDFSNFDIQLWWIRMYSLSYARKIMDFKPESFIKNLSGGISVKMVNGYGYLGTDKINAHFSTGENNIITGEIHTRMLAAKSKDFGGRYPFDTQTFKSNMGPQPESAGSGMGFDVGFAADLDYGLRVGLSITDIGSITWDKGTAEFRTDKNLVIDDIDSLNRVNFLNDTSFSSGSFTTSLPTALRFGVTYEVTKGVPSIPGMLLLALDYNQGFNKMPSNSTTPRLSIGAMWKTKPYIPVISTGLTNDMSGAIRWSAGLGFSTRALDFHISSLDLLSVFTSGSANPHASAALNFVWRIAY